MATGIVRLAWLSFAHARQRLKNYVERNRDPMEILSVEGPQERPQNVAIEFRLTSGACLASLAHVRGVGPSISHRSFH